MWTVYVWEDEHQLSDIVNGVLTEKLLEVLEICTMRNSVQMIEVAYGNEVYTVYVRR